jgi:hypothetical protein
MDDYTIIVPNNGEPVAWHTFKESHSKWTAFARIEAALERDGKFEGKKWNITPFASANAAARPRQA